MTNTAKLIALAIATAALPTSAQAKETQSVSVSYADLNLQSEAGIETLDRRLRHAAEKVCGDRKEANITFGGSARACVSQTASKLKSQRDIAIAEANGPQLAFRERKIRLALR